MTGYLDLFDHTFEKTQQKFAELLQQADQAPLPTSLITDALEDLSIAFEEAHVLSEELTTQHDQLQVLQSTLAMERQQYFELFNLAPEGYIVTDHRGVIEQINLIGANLLNRRQRVCIGKPLATLVSPADRQHFYNLIYRLQKGVTLQDVDLCLQPSQRETLSANFTIAVVRDYQSQIVGYRWLFRDLSAQHRAAIALEESEAQYRAIVEDQTEFICRFLADGSLTFSNQAFCQSLDRSADELLGANIFEQILAVDQAVVLQKLAMLDRDQPVRTLEHRVRLPNGQIHWQQWTHRALFHEQGDFFQFQSVGRDITAQKQAEIALQQRETQLRLLTDSLPVLMAYLDTQQRVLYANRTHEAWFQKHATEIAGQYLWEVLGQAAYQPLKTPIERALSGESVTVEQAMVLPQQGTIWTNVNLEPDWSDLGQVQGCFVLVNNISDRKQSETALRESEQRYASLAAAVPVGIFRTDAVGDCLYVNERWCEIAGLSPTEAIGKGWIQWLHPDDRDPVLAEWYQSVQNNRSFQLEYRFQRPNGQVTWVYGQAVAERDLHGEIIGHVGTITDISTLRQAQNLLTHNALHDSLTNLPNRALLLERLELILNKARRTERYNYAVLFLDLDRFKIINDSLGHLIGDQVLTQIAQTLQTHVQETDVVARLGGDEFVILLEETDATEQVVQIAERILADSKTPFIIERQEIFTSFSMGIVLGNPDYHQASDLIRDADIAMYRAKANGKNVYEFFDVSMHTQAQTRMTLETDLRKALEQKEFTVYYQPIFEVSDNRLVGFEALVRWQHPQRGLILPDDFVPVVEEMGLIVILDNWVFYQACQQMARWRNQFAQRFPLKISINLSAQDLVNNCSLQEIDRILAETGLAGDAIILEITESMLIEDIEKTIDWLTQLATRDIQISIDDFGTGYSSLHYLHRLPVHTLKIDGSFVGKMQVNDRNYQIVNTIITLGNQLGLTVVAEGIEQPQQLQQLQDLGCQLGQGHLFSKALPAAEITAQFLQSKG